MNDVPSFEQQLASGLDQLAGPRRSVDAMAISRDVIATQSPKWRFQSMFSATKFAVAGAILAVFGGFLFSSLMMLPSDESAPAASVTTAPTEEPATEQPSQTTADAEARATRPISLPAAVPEAVQSGTFDTPLGAARWVHLRGSAEEMPFGMATTVAAGDVFMTLDWSGRLWTSPNLIEWNRIAGPTEFVSSDGYHQLAEMGGYLWLSSGPPGVDLATDTEQRFWRSPDGQDWEEVDLRALLPAGPPGEQWGLRFRDSVALGDLLVVETQATPVVSPLERLGLGHAGLRKAEDGRYFASNAREREYVFESTDEGLNVVAPKEKDSGFIGGWTMEYVDWVTRGYFGHEGYIRQPGLAVLMDGEFEAVQLPGGRPNGRIEVRPVEDGLLAMLRSRGPDAAWTSSDGRVWWEVGSELEVPGVVEEGDPFSGLGPRKAPDAWASLGSGWLVLQDGKFSFQSDGNEDVRVRKSQIPPLVARDGFDGPGQAISHETTVIWRDIPGGANSLWILTLDAVGEERRSD